MYLFLTVVAVFILLFGNEQIWRKKGFHNEASRKFIHLAVGSFVAFWPFFLSWNQIRLLSAAFLIVVAISKYFHLFRAIHSVQRPTWGEMFFAVAVGVVTLITQNKWVYMAALLQMSLADGLAAIIGVAYGKRRHYLIFGQTKSLIGTATFIVVSVYILLSFTYLSGIPISLAAIIGLSYAAALIENIGVFGLDNLLVPVLISIILQRIVG